MKAWKRDPEERETYKGVVLAARERGELGWILETNAEIVRRAEGGPARWISAAAALAAGRAIVDRLLAAREDPCASCGHLMREHGPNFCAVLACPCGSLDSPDPKNDGASA